MSNQTYQLVVRRGPQEGHVFPLAGDMMTIGRDPMSDITLNDPEISRQHARLARSSDGSYEIQDLGSTNGTFVDGNRLGGERVHLSPGQVLVLGSNVSLVLEAMPDQMATVVASRSDFDLEQFAEPEPMAPLMMEPEPEPEPEPEAEPAGMDEAVPTDKLEPDMAPLPSMVAAAAIDEMTDDEPAELEPEPEPAMDYNATIIDQSFEKPSYPVFEAQEPAAPSFAEPEPLPAYEDDAAKTMMDAGAAMSMSPPPSASPPPAAMPSYMAQQPSGPSTPPPYQASPPPPPPPAPVSTEPAGGGGNNRNRNIIIIVVVLVLLCCCCSILTGGWFYGDAILRELNLGALPLDLMGAYFA